MLCQVLKVDLPDYDWDRARTRGDVPPEKVNHNASLKERLKSELGRVQVMKVKTGLETLIADSRKNEEGGTNANGKCSPTYIHFKFWSGVGQICAP